jgi:hypothetical protein
MCLNCKVVVVIRLKSMIRQSLFEEGRDAKLMTEIRRGFAGNKISGHSCTLVCLDRLLHRLWRKGFCPPVCGLALPDASESRQSNLSTRIYLYSGHSIQAESLEHEYTFLRIKFPQFTVHRADTLVCPYVIRPFHRYCMKPPSCGQRVRLLGKCFCRGEPVCSPFCFSDFGKRRTEELAPKIRISRALFSFDKGAGL